MAQIQVELAQCQFGQIGSLRYDKGSGEFTIGPKSETGLGPWKSSFAYYHDAAEHALNSCASDMELNTRCSFALPLLFKELVRRYCFDDTGPFSLTNRDFGFHNILVDDNFSIIGVIDFDGIVAAPKEVVGQFPALCALDRLLQEFVKAREEQEKPSIESYATSLRTLAIGSERQIFADIMSIPKSLVRGLNALISHQNFVNDQWMDSFLYLLRKRIIEGFN
jgi:hypothetical protein